MTEPEFAAGLSGGTIKIEEPSSEDDAHTSEGELPISQFIPILSLLQSTQRALSAPPTFIPQTFQDQIQFVYNGSSYSLYVYIANTWQQIPIGSAEASGTIKAFGGSTAPTGYLLCDGSAVSRTTYAALFTAIGTAYGSGNGTTTFNVPDARGKVLAGYKSGDTNFGTLGATVGEASHILTTTEMPSHSHPLTIYTQSTFASGPLWNGDATHGSPNTATTGSVGGGAAHNNVQPSLTVNYIIKT